jgi:hypothetical protein
MALTGGDVCTAIITKGIGCLPACESIITAQFSLAGLCVITVIPGRNTGGSYPLAPGEIANLYQPVDAPAGFEDHPAFLTPQDQRDPFKIRQQVRVVVDFRGKVTEREYVVSPRRVSQMVTVANFINKTAEKISVAFGGFKKIAKESVQILNFRKKR